MAEVTHDENNEGGTLMPTIVTGIAVAVLAPELLPGMAIGVAAMLAPKLLPSVGVAVRPLVKTAVRLGYATAVQTKELVAEASEQIQDIAAEARLEQEHAEHENGRHRSKHTTAKRRATA
jgi:hypothetical protein